MSKKNETSSDGIKDGLVDLYTGSEAKDWKRKSKTALKGGSGHNVKRVFENAKLGVEVVVYGDEGDDFGAFNEAGKMLFFAEDLDEDGVLEYDVEAGCFVMFAAETFWNRNHYIPDNHISSFLSEHYGVDLSDFDEMSENQFLVDAPAADVIARLEAAGFRHEPQMKRAGQWSEDEGGGEAPAYSTDLDPYYYDEFPYPEYGKRFDSETGEFRTIWTRTQAQGRMERLYEGEEEIPDFAAMSNEELGSELCLSGVIHDESFGEVIDDDGMDRFGPLVEPGQSYDAAKPGEHKLTTAFIVKNLVKQTGTELWSYDSVLEGEDDVLNQLFGDAPRQTNLVFRFRSVKSDDRVYIGAFAPQGNEGSLVTWVASEDNYFPEAGATIQAADPELFTQQWAPTPEPWKLERVLGGGMTMYSRPVQYAPYEDGGPVTEEAIQKDLEEHFSTYGGPYRWEKSAIPDEKKDLKIIRRYDGFKGDKKVIRAVVFSKNESDANQLETCEDDDVWLFGFWEEEEGEDGEVAVWFAGKTFYEREGTCSDQHCGWELTLLHPIPDYLDQDMENHFVIDEKMQSKITKEVLKAELESRGFIFHEEVMDL